MVLDTVECDVAEGFDNDPPKKKKPSSYGFIGRCFDGVNIQIKQIYMNVETYDGILDNPNPRRVRMSMTNLNIFSTNSDWQKCELKDVFIRNKEKTAVIFHKKLECESVSFSFQTTNPVTQETDWSTPLSQLPLDVTIRVKKEVKDGDVLCGELGFIFDSMNVTFREYEWHQMFDFCKGLVATLTKKISDDPANPSPAPTPSPKIKNNNNNNNNDDLPEDVIVDDIPLDDVNNNNNNSQPHIWNEPKKEFKTEEEEWDLVKSDKSDFNQTKFTVVMNKGKLTMCENVGELTSENQFALFLFDNLVWTCHISPYEYRKKKLVEKIKLSKKKDQPKDNNKKKQLIRKKLAVMTLNLQKILILGAYPDRTSLLDQSRDDNEAAIQLRWLVHTEHPEEQDITVWLRSLIIDMFVVMHNVNVIFQREEWFRILGFFNLTNTASALSDATSSVEFRLHGDVTNSVILLTDRTKYTPGCECLKMVAKKARFGSDLGLDRNPAFDSGIFRRYIDSSLSFPSAPDDFTYGARFVNSHKPRKFQFSIEQTAGYVNDHQILEPVDVRIEFRLQNFLDRQDENKLTGENLIAYLDINETELSITASQYAYFYRTVFHMWDDIKREFIPSLSKSNEINPLPPSPYSDLIPTHIPAYADKLIVRIYDDDVMDVQLQRGRGEDVPFPPPPLIVTMRGLEFVSEIYSSRKSASIAVKSAEIIDSKYPDHEIEKNEGNCLSGRFVFALEDVDSESKILLNGIKAHISKENLDRAQSFIKSQNEGMVKRIVVLNEDKHSIDFTHCEVLIDGEKYEGFPPELIHLLKEVIPFWR